MLVFPRNVQVSHPYSVPHNAGRIFFLFTIDFQHARMYECVFVYGLVLNTLIDNE